MTINEKLPDNIQSLVDGLLNGKFNRVDTYTKNNAFPLDVDCTYKHETNIIVKTDGVSSVFTRVDGETGDTITDVRVIGASYAMTAYYLDDMWFYTLNVPESELHSKYDEIIEAYDVLVKYVEEFDARYLHLSAREG